MIKYFAFTLLELLTLLTLITVLSLAAVPTIHHILQNQYSNEVAYRLVMALQFARLNAIERQETIIVCPSRDQRICGGQWRDGQIVTTLHTEQVLRTLSPIPTAAILHWHSSLNKNNFIEFAATGFTTGQQGSFYYCSSQNRPGRAIIINYSGRIRTTKRDAAGNPIYCD